MSIGSEMQVVSQKSWSLYRGKPLPVDNQAVEPQEEVDHQKDSVNHPIEPAQFQELLSWLDPDPESAGWQYERIRQKLITIFTFRGCAFPDELADETINRVTRKLPQIKPSYVGSPTRYFYGVAKRVHLESMRRVPVPKFLPAASVIENTEELFQLLDYALSKLPQADKELILSYYQEDGQSKINHRKALAKKMGLELNSLRVRIYRIRAQLRSNFQMR